MVDDMVQCTQQIVKFRFTKEQMIEIKQFEKDLEAGKVDIVFTGTFEEGVQFLKDTGDFVDAFTYS